MKASTKFVTKTINLELSEKEAQAITKVVGCMSLNAIYKACEGYVNVTEEEAVMFQNLYAALITELE